MRAAYASLVVLLLVGATVPVTMAIPGPSDSAGGTVGGATFDRTLDSHTAVTSPERLSATGERNAADISATEQNAADISASDSKANDASANGSVESTSFGTRVSSFVQSTSASTSGYVESEMWQKRAENAEHGGKGPNTATNSNPNTDRDSNTNADSVTSANPSTDTNTTANATARSKMLEKRLDTLEERLSTLKSRQQQLREEYQNGNITELRYHARMAEIDGQLTGLESAVNATETVADRKGERTPKLDEVRTEIKKTRVSPSDVPDRKRGNETENGPASTPNGPNDQTANGNRNRSTERGPRGTHGNIANETPSANATDVGPKTSPKKPGNGKTNNGHGNGRSNAPGQQKHPSAPASDANGTDSNTTSPSATPSKPSVTPTAESTVGITTPGSTKGESSTQHPPGQTSDDKAPNNSEGSDKTPNNSKGNRVGGTSGNSGNSGNHGQPNSSLTATPALSTTANHSDLTL